MTDYINMQYSFIQWDLLFKVNIAIIYAILGLFK